jgi:hypothetical protein
VQRIQHSCRAVGNGKAFLCICDGIWFFWQWTISFTFFCQVGSEKGDSAGKYGHFNGLAANDTGRVGISHSGYHKAKVVDF